MKKFLSIISYLIILLFLTLGGGRIAIAQLDSTLIASKGLENLDIFIWSYKDGTKKQEGKFYFKTKTDEVEYILPAFTPVDNIIKIHYGRDNYMRKSCSIIYLYGSGYYFLTAIKNNGKWESQSKHIVRFEELRKSSQIKKITFAHHKPKIFKVEYSNTEKPPKVFAEINGIVEWIDCHTCTFRE